MKTLNLINLEESTIKYKINNYPDGQRDINIDLESLYDVSMYKENYKNNVATIKSRLNNMEDLGLIICTTQALYNLGVKEIHLYVPYIMGLRSDRLFVGGGVRYIKDVLAPILNSQNYESVTCYDAHSYVAENCINRLKVISNIDLIRFSIRNIYQPLTENSTQRDWILIAPDAGASHKIYKSAEAIGYTGDIIICSKERDANGKLTKTTVPLTSHCSVKDLIIIDDICDGGNTFINIAIEIDNYKKKLISNGGAWSGKLYLIVTHGIFSAGYANLSKYFDGMYCTNSYKHISQKEYHALGNTKTNVKQLNIF